MSLSSSTNGIARMKRLLSILAFSLFMITSIAAQGNGNGNGNGGYGNNGNGNGGYNNPPGGGQANGYVQGNNPWVNVNWPQWLISWLQNGGQIPPLLAADVIWDARAWGMQNFGLSYGQMLQKYGQGQLTLQYVSTSPPTLLFRVRFGGLNIDVIVDA